MKTLEEKKLLVKMARMLGEPVDPLLVESIEKEEKLSKMMFGEEPEPLVEEIVQEEPPVLLKEADPPFPVSNNLLQKLSQFKTVTPTPAPVPAPVPAPAPEPPKVPPMIEKLQKDELEAMKRTLNQLMNKVNTLSWGGGGTGVVRYYDLDDHQYPVDVKALSFNVAGPDYDPPDGSISWNPTEECMDIHQPDGTTLQVGLEQYIRVKNLTGNTMNNGTLVQFAGVNGGFDPIVTPLIANTTFDPIYTVGVLTEPIANGENGRATTFGKVRELNTTGTPDGEVWNIGDLLWADPAHPGRLTNVKPTAPNTAISIAAVTRVDATEGEILVRPTITPRLFYGTFAQTANQALAAADTAYPVLFDKTNFANGHTLNANGIITSQVTGLFKYDVNYNITSSNASRAYVYMWIRKNGVNQQNTALRFSIESNGGEAVPHGSFVLSMQPGDNVQMMIAASATSISLFGLGASGIYPSAPSAVLSISQMTQ